MTDLYSEPSRIQQLVLITNPSVQANTFATYLTESLSATVQIHNIHKPLTQRLQPRAIVLFDIVVSNKKLNSIWRDIIQSYCEQPRLLIINSAQMYELYEISQWPFLYGIFRYDDDSSRLLEGIKTVLNDEQMPELNVMHPAMYTDHASSVMENLPLTERECEILNELRHGATNMDIARALFISENTVRTHLYNVFRKLSVKNRTQAVSWANEHLRH